MAVIKKTYTPKFKKKMVKLVLEEGHQMKSANQEYNLAEAKKENDFLKKAGAFFAKELD